MKRNSAELKRIARHILNGRYGLPMVAILITFLLPSLLMIPFASITQSSPNHFQIVLYYLAYIVISLISCCLHTSLTRIFMKLSRNQQCSMSDMTWAFSNRPGKFIWAFILEAIYMLLVSSPFLLCTHMLDKYETTEFTILTIAFGIVAIIFSLFILLTYALVTYLLIDAPNASVIAAFHESHRLMRGNRLRLLGICFSFIGWIILGVLSFYIGFLWIAPYMFQTFSNFYMDIMQLNYPAPKSDVPPKSTIDITVGDK